MEGRADAFGRDRAESVTLPDGTAVRIRPLLPSDADALREGFRALSPESRFHRFLAPMTELDDDMIRLLVDDVDGRRHIALVLTAPADGGGEEPVGVGRLVQSDTDESTADVALTVADAWQHRGVGTALGRALLERRPPAVRRLSTVIAADNAVSLEMLGALGEPSRETVEGGVVQVCVELDPAEGG